MDKEQYYKISEEKKLDCRCPILNKCGRHAYTIYLFSYYDYDKEGNMIKCLKKNGEIEDEFEKDYIKIQGESPSRTMSSDSFSFFNVCPEVRQSKENN